MLKSLENGLEFYLINTRDFHLHVCIYIYIYKILTAFFTNSSIVPDMCRLDLE